MAITTPVSNQIIKSGGRDTNFNIKTQTAGKVIFPAELKNWCIYELHISIDLILNLIN